MWCQHIRWIVARVCLYLQRLARFSVCFVFMYYACSIKAERSSIIVATQYLCTVGCYELPLHAFIHTYVYCIGPAAAGNEYCYPAPTLHCDWYHIDLGEGGLHLKALMNAIESACSVHLQVSIVKCGNSITAENRPTNMYRS